jgi:hypothetical protein
VPNSDSFASFDFEFCLFGWLVVAGVEGIDERYSWQRLKNE